MSTIFHHYTPLRATIVLFVSSHIIMTIFISTKARFFAVGTTKDLFVVMNFRLYPRIFVATCARIMVLELEVRKPTVAFGLQLAVNVGSS
jgi:hypothetical protein